jgi:hypothetical protein
MVVMVLVALLAELIDSQGLFQIQPAQQLPDVMSHSRLTRAPGRLLHQRGRGREGGLRIGSFLNRERVMPFTRGFRTHPCRIAKNRAFRM